jgi:hypothetical protein
MPMPASLGSRKKGTTVPPCPCRPLSSPGTASRWADVTGCRRRSSAALSVGRRSSVVGGRGLGARGGPEQAMPPRLRFHGALVLGPAVRVYHKFNLRRRRARAMERHSIHWRTTGLIVLILAVLQVWAVVSHHWNKGATHPPVGSSTTGLVGLSSFIESSRGMETKLRCGWSVQRSERASW